jgi:hypothetical protein
MISLLQFLAVHVKSAITETVRAYATDSIGRDPFYEGTRKHDKEDREEGNGGELQVVSLPFPSTKGFA